ncbi:LacI family DNA-binding transcriptional regulator [Paludibaculum fermentans]|uniref:LacI family DNA-binding transcriptional regulator n=1 Tax=Paludibaculum fermentans TaxID=1473598 RepID=UPI003EB7F58A
MGIRDVAKRAGVSVATVSRTVNGVRSVSPEIAARVWSAVNAVGYVPNTQARALVSGRSRILGLIVSDITNPFYPELIQGFEQFAVQAGYEVLLGATNYDPAMMATTVRRMIERKVEGVAVMTSEIEPSLMEQLTGRSIPLVFVDIGPPGRRIGNIQVNYEAGIRQAVQHLYRLGHRRLAFIGGPGDLKSAQLRRESFLRCTSGSRWKGARPLMLEGDHKLAGGCAAVQRLLSATPRPTAVFCSNDLTAIGVLRGLDVEGLRAPQDLSVIGFDDIQMAEYSIPPLTTVRLPRLDLARQAFQSLMAGLDEKSAPGHQPVPIETSLVVRGSTARIGAGG